MTIPADPRDPPFLRFGLPGLVCIAVLFGIGLRLWHITIEPLWLDEAYSAYAAEKGFAFLWQVVPRYETHPPFYYSLVRLWTLPFGNDLTALRALGAVAGILTLAAIGWAAAELARTIQLNKARSALLVAGAVVIGCVTPMLVEMSHEVRPYPLIILCYTLAIALLFRIGRRTASGGALARADFAAYLILLALILWLHNLGLLYVGALSLALLALFSLHRFSRRDWMALISGHALVLLIWLPAVMILLDQAPTWIRSTWVRFPPADLGNRIMTGYGVPYAMSAAAGLALAAMAIPPLLRGNIRRRALIALTALATAPLLVSLAVSALLTPIYIMRTMTPLGVPALLLFAAGAALARGLWRWVAGLALVVLLTQMIGADLSLRRAGAHEDWYGVVRWLKARIAPGDIVLTYPNEGSLPFDRAVRDLSAHIPSHPIPVAVPAFDVGGWYPTGSRGVVSLPQARLRVITQSPAIAKAPTIWLIRMGPWAYDKGDVFLHELGRGRTRIAHEQNGVIVLDGLRKTATPR